MPCLSGRFDPAIGPVINIGVAGSGLLTPGSSAAASALTFPALVDTGATTTCISAAVATAVGLTPIGLRAMASATHSVPVNVYLVDLALPFGKTGLVANAVQVMEFQAAGGSPFQMLVGRDLICRGCLTISFDGHFTFCL